jgi:predicted transposase YbfD/YdcC
MTVTDRYYISNIIAIAEAFAAVIRGHWSIENQLHWSLDVLFREDASPVRNERAPENLNILRKIAGQITGNRCSWSTVKYETEDI